MLWLANILNITKPCQELYDALVDTHAKDENGNIFNEDPLPTEAMTLEFFQHRRYPITETVNINYIIVFISKKENQNTQKYLQARSKRPKYSIINFIYKLQQKTVFCDLIYHRKLYNRKASIFQSLKTLHNLS